MTIHYTLLEFIMKHNPSVGNEVSCVISFISLQWLLCLEPTSKSNCIFSVFILLTFLRRVSLSRGSRKNYFGLKWQSAFTERPGHWQNQWKVSTMSNNEANEAATHLLKWSWLWLNWLEPHLEVMTESMPMTARNKRKILFCCHSLFPTWLRFHFYHHAWLMNLQLPFRPRILFLIR